VDSILGLQVPPLVVTNARSDKCLVGGVGAGVLCAHVWRGAPLMGAREVSPPGDPVPKKKKRKGRAEREKERKRLAALS
jgi:hypothetical protein